MSLDHYSSGADFLGPLLPAVAEICADFDPTGNVEPSLLKLFRNLWFYIALYGLAPPIQKVQSPAKSSSNSNLGNASTVALQAVGGPYMWETQWSSAVQRIARGTPALVSSFSCHYILCKLMHTHTIVDCDDFIVSHYVTVHTNFCR